MSAGQQIAIQVPIPPIHPIPSPHTKSEPGKKPEPSEIVQVGSEAAESFISEKRIGERIKGLRLRKQMGLVELGRHTGLSASFLSQLETGRVVPTLRNLARIAMVFSKDLSYFFEPEPHKLFRVHKSKNRVRLPQSGVEDPSYFFESLGYLVPDRQLDPYFAEFLPHKEGREERAHQHAGYEFLYLLSGQLDLRHGETMHSVEAGDAIYFDATVKHSYVCNTDEPATALIVTMQQGSAPALHATNGNARIATAIPAGLNGSARKTREMNGRSLAGAVSESSSQRAS